MRGMKTISMALIGLAILAGCETATVTSQSPQVATFIEYSLAEYVVTHSDELVGDGGGWWTHRYKLRPGYRVKREDIAKRVWHGLINTGWKPLDPPQRKYTVSRMFETAADDLHFRHGPFPGEGPDAFHIQHIYISPGADILTCYFESKW